MTKTEARKLAKACRAAVDLHTVGHAMAGVLFALPAYTLLHYLFGLGIIKI